jgi:hypothetical protein
MFYKLFKRSHDKKVVGYLDQTNTGESFAIWYNTQERGSIQRDRLLPSLPNFELIVHNKAKLTAILDLSNLPFGLVINERTKILFEKMVLPPFSKFYEIGVIHKGEKYKYYWFYAYVNMFDYIDFEKSVFDLFYDTKQEVKKILTFKDEQEFQSFRSPPYIVRAKKLVLKSDFPNFDIIFDNIFGDTIISHRMAIMLKENNILGYEVNENALMYPGIYPDSTFI